MIRLPLLAAALAAGLGFTLLLNFGTSAVQGGAILFAPKAFATTLAFAVLPYLPLVVFADTRTGSWLVVSGINAILASLGFASLASAPLLGSSSEWVIGTASQLFGLQLIAVLTVMIAVPLIWLMGEP